MSLFNNLTTADDLKKQLDHYRTKAQVVLSEDGVQELNKGVTEYQQHYLEKINAYRSAQGLNPQLNLNTPTNYNYFREQFIHYLLTHSLPLFSGDEKSRQINPETAALPLEKLLGRFGVELYKLALEEEMHSTQYRQAVVANATTFVQGGKWQTRPAVIVAGPSGCGKSYAAQSAIKVADEFLPKMAATITNNPVIAVDGGIIRETSQMRKLLIQVATNQGYSGIKDLHAQSYILEKMKYRLQEAAFATMEAGIVIPETFSQWINPLHPVHQLMKRIDSLPNTKQIFTRVDGEQAENFQRVVAYMGTRRAWKTQNFNHEARPPAQSIDLNHPTESESKAYESSGFKFGQWGSLSAEKWFRSRTKARLSMVITNDLVLLKPNLEAQHEDWIPAKPGDTGATLISRANFASWSKLPLTDRPTLTDFNKSHASPKIATSAQIDIAIVQSKLNKSAQRALESMSHEAQKIAPNEQKVKYFVMKHQYVTHLATVEVNKLTSREDIAKLKETVQGYMENIKEQKKSMGKSPTVSITLTQMKKFSKKLDKLLHELEPQKSAVNNSTKNCIDSNQRYKDNFQEIIAGEDSTPKLVNKPR